MTDTRGLHDKFIVHRTDGNDGPGDKHDGCRYFVLDLTHDEAARMVLLSLAGAYFHTGRKALATDLLALHAQLETRVVPGAGAETGGPDDE